MKCLDRYSIKEFPYIGEFYHKVKDSFALPSEQVEQDVVLLKTKCNIQEAGGSLGEFINASYKIYFPYDSCKYKTFPFKKNDLFKCNIDGFEVKGTVIGIFPSQLNKTYVYIKD